MSAKSEKIKDILNELLRNSEISSAAVISTKGYMMASAIAQEVDEKAIAAMSAALTSVARRVTSTLDAGETTSIVINGSKQIVIIYTSAKAALIALSPADAKIGLMDFEMSAAMDKIKEVLG